MSSYHPDCGHHGDYVMGIGENMYCGVCKIERLSAENARNTEIVREIEIVAYADREPDVTVDMLLDWMRALVSTGQK